MVNGRRTRPAALLLDAMVINVFVWIFLENKVKEKERFGEEERGRKIASESKDKRDS